MNVPSGELGWCIQEGSGADVVEKLSTEGANERASM